MIKKRKEKKNKMIKLFYSTILSLIFIFFVTNLGAEAKKDCSEYSSKTLVGLMDKTRCKKGLPPLKKNFLKDLEYKSIKTKKNKNSYVEGKNCHEYSTKTFVGLAAKIKCIRNK